MNFLTMQTRLRERIGNPTTQDVSAATLAVRLNEAYEIIWDRYRFHANRARNVSVVTVAGTDTYTLPVTGDVVRSVRDTTNRIRLKKLMQREWESRDHSSGTGKPVSYYIEDGILGIDPKPDGAYSLDIEQRKIYVALASDNDVPTIPASWHLGIVILARYQHWEVTGNWQMTQAALAIWNNWVESKSDEVAEEIFADSSFNFQPEGLENSTRRLDFDHST